MREESHLARLQPRATSLAPFEFTPEQRKLIRDTFLNGANDQEAEVLLEIAKARRLNPLTQQIYFVKRWDERKGCDVWRAQTGIDGLRLIAERSGLYDGQDEPEFEETEKGIKLCRVKVHRKDWARPAVGVAYWAEYVQTTKAGGPNSMWARGKHFMLAKCAEALALRKAFPEETSGLYIQEEMGSDTGPEKEINSPPAQPKLGSRVQQLAAEVRAKAGPIMDVQAGETEEEARERYEDAEVIQMAAETPLEDVKPKAPPPERTKATLVKFGYSKGKHLDELEAKNLTWHLTAARKAVDGMHPQFHDENKAWLAAVEAEVVRRGM